MTRRQFCRRACKVASILASSIKQLKRWTRCAGYHWSQFIRSLCCLLLRLRPRNHSTHCLGRLLNSKMTILNTWLNKCPTTPQSRPLMSVGGDGATLSTRRSILPSTASLFQFTSSSRLISICKSLMKLTSCPLQPSAFTMSFLCPWWAPCTTILATQWLLSTRADLKRNVRSNSNGVAGLRKSGIFSRVAPSWNQVMERVRKYRIKSMEIGINKWLWQIKSQANPKWSGLKTHTPKSTTGCTAWTSFIYKPTTSQRDFMVWLRLLTREDALISEHSKMGTWLPLKQRKTDLKIGKEPSGSTTRLIISSLSPVTLSSG